MDSVFDLIRPAAVCYSVTHGSLQHNGLTGYENVSSELIGIYGRWFSLYTCTNLVEQCRVTYLEQKTSIISRILYT